MANHQVATAAAVYQCKSCEREKEAAHFYASNLSRCKECVKASVRANRAERIDYYRSYDRMRYREDDARKAHCIAMGKTVPMEVRTQKQRERRQADPSKNIARLAVARAVKKGQIRKSETCYFCASPERLQAHHHDYSKPLDVFWLCSACHGKLHAINGDFHRGVR